jgi:hypothetical protein
MITTIQGKVVVAERRMLWPGESKPESLQTAQHFILVVRFEKQMNV